MSHAPTGLGEPCHPYLGMGKLRPREGKQLSQAAPGQALGRGTPRLPMPYLSDAPPSPTPGP